MKFYVDMMRQSLEDARDDTRLGLLDADWYESELLRLMEQIETPQDAAGQLGAMMVLSAQLVEKVRQADPSYGLTAL